MRGNKGNATIKGFPLEETRLQNFASACNKLSCKKFESPFIIMQREKNFHKILQKNTSNFGKTLKKHNPNYKSPEATWDTH